MPLSGPSILPRHRLSHEPGGNDPITRLRLIGTAEDTSPLQLDALVAPPDARTWRFINDDGRLRFEAVNDAQDTVQATPLLLNRNGEIQVQTNIHAGGFVRAPGGLADTPLHADFILSGTLPDARLSINVLKHSGGYPGGVANFLRADGVFAAPSGGTIESHHTTHELGGTDPVSLAQSQISGLEPILSSHTSSINIINNDAAFKNQVNIFTTNQLISSNVPTLVFTDTAQPANLKNIYFANSGRALQINAVNDDYSSVVGLLQLDRTGNARFGGNVAERGRPAPMGDWTYFSPQLIPTTGTITGGTRNMNYSIVGKTLTVLLSLNDLTFSGGIQNITVQLPFVADLVAGTGYGSLVMIYTGTWGTCLAFVNAAGAGFTLNGPFADGAGRYIWGTLTFILA